jgi:hypothetical protein
MIAFLLMLTPQRRLLQAACPIVALISVAFGTAESNAQMSNSNDWQLSDINADVPGHAGISFLDLLRQVMPDLAANETIATGRRTHPFRHIVEGYGGEPPDRIAIASLQVATFIVANAPRIAILAPIGTVETTVEQPVLLAVFEGGDRPTLIDAVDVGMDRDTSFGVPALVNISPGDQALLIRSSHFNSSESFETTAFIMLQGNTLELVDTFSTYGIRTCGEQMTQTLVLAEQKPSDADAYSEILATIEEASIVTQGGCNDETSVAPLSENASTVYRWNPGQRNFFATSDNLERFEARTAERMNAP